VVLKSNQNQNSQNHETFDRNPAQRNCLCPIIYASNGSRKRMPILQKWKKWHPSLVHGAYTTGKLGTKWKTLKIIPKESLWRKSGTIAESWWVGTHAYLAQKQADMYVLGKSTLIIVSSSAIGQWFDEIHNHIEVTIFLRVIKFRPSQDLEKITLKTTTFSSCSVLDFTSKDAVQFFLEWQMTRILMMRKKKYYYLSELVFYYTLSNGSRWAGKGLRETGHWVSNSRAMIRAENLNWLNMRISSSSDLILVLVLFRRIEWSSFCYWQFT